MARNNSVRDWRKLVLEKIGRLDLPPSQRDEIAAELASHLEEVREEKRAQGLPESEAIERTLSEVFDWNDLARRIHRAKREEGIVNDRTKHLWLPGLASVSAAVAIEVALARLSYEPFNIARSHTTQIMYGLWLVGQLFCGAAGAFLSRRAGGSRSARIAAALFTSGVLLATMFVVIAICAIGRATGLAFTALDMSLRIKPVFVVVLVPSIAMLLGALPFLSDQKESAAA
ncbi:MAG TPA: hypothetical protein VJW93_07590 [Candidatus Acidoferrales bacterium]|nr:hypothetical protein [Candidatus Acidoferrales bacterium]